MDIQQAYILTAHWSDSESGLELRYYAVSENGPIEIVFTGQEALFFVEKSVELQDLPRNAHIKDVKLKNFSGADVKAIYFKKQTELYKYRDTLADRGIRTFEADIRPEERFRMERFINTSVEIMGKLSEPINGLRKIVNPQIRPGTYRPTLSTASIDIETSMGTDLYSIAVQYKHGDVEKKKVFMVGEGSSELEYLELLPTERKMYQAFQDYFQELDPDLILGWHVVGFDLKFLEKKCQNWGTELRLGRKKSKIVIQEGKSGQNFTRIEGRAVVDGPPAMRAAFYSFDDFKLDTVANALLGVGKDITATAEEKVAEITRRFHDDKEALAKYNLMDCELVTQIYEKTGLIELIVTRTMLSGMLFDRIGGSTAAFDHFFMPRLHRKGLVSPNVFDIQREAHAAGGYVLEPEVGLHEHVIVLDFKSLYPSIIRTFKIDPYSRVKSEIHPIETPVKVNFSRSENILPVFLEELMDKRALAKQNNDNYLSQAIKILMNSFYGVMGSPGSRFYHADLPTAITGTGQWILLKAIEFLQTNQYEVLYGDTDSVFIKLKDNERFSPFEHAEKLASKVNTHMNELLESKFKVESHLELEFEKYYRKFFLPQARNAEGGAKKRYAGLLVDNSGKEELSFTGMEIVRSDWTKVAKKFQYELFEKVFHGEDVEDWIRNFVEELKNGEFDTMLVYKKRLAKKLDEYTKNIPQHVKAARQLVEAGKPVGRDIYYVITRRGPVPIELDHTDVDYQHYIEKQIKPLADSLLFIYDMNFDNIVIGDQLTLF